MKWFLFYPELYYFAGGMGFLCLSLGKRSNPRRDYFTALVLAALGVVVCLTAVRQEGLLFLNAYRLDLFSQVFKVILSLALFLTICICSELKGVSERHHPEFYFLLFVFHSTYGQRGIARRLMHIILHGVPRPHPFSETCQAFYTA